MDYVFFMYGTAFILLGAVCFILSRREASTLPWIWLGVFGLLHGINEWADLTVIAVGDSPIFAAFRAVVMTLSFIALAEFGRAGMGTLRGRTLGRWILVPWLAATMLGGLSGLAGFNAAVRYLFGFLGGMVSACVFVEYGRRTSEGRRFIWTAASLMAAYAVCTGLVVPEAGFFRVLI